MNQRRAEAPPTDGGRLREAVASGLTVSVCSCSTRHNRIPLLLPRCKEHTQRLFPARNSSVTRASGCLHTLAGTHPASRRCQDLLWRKLLLCLQTTPAKRWHGRVGITR